MTLRQNLIGGEWVGADGAETTNPSNTKEVVGIYARAGVDETKSAIAAAKAAFPAWSRSGILERHSILKNTSDEILARKEELGALLAREEGKSLPEAIGEIDFPVPFGGRKALSFGSREQGKYAAEFLHRGENGVHAFVTIASAFWNRKIQ